MKNKSLIFKTSLSTTIVILILGFFATVFVYYYSGFEFEKRAKESLISQSKDQSNRVRQRLDLAKEIAGTIATQDFALDVLENPSALTQQDPMSIKHLQYYLFGDYYSAIYIMNTDGQVVLSTEESFFGKNYAFRDYFKEAMIGNEYTDVSFGVTSNMFGYYVSTPILVNGETQGVVVTKLNEKYISEVIETGFDTYDRNIYLIDKNGVVIYASREDSLFKTLGKISVEKKTELEAAKRYGDKEIEPLSYDIIQASLETIKAPELFSLYDDAHNEKEIVSVNSLLDNNFYCMVEVSEKEVLGQARRISALLASLIAVAAISSVLLIVYNLRYALKPIKEVSATADKLAKGDFTARVKYEREDEIGDISRSINAMADSIEYSQKNLEKKIEERTSRLQKINKYMVDRELKMIELKKQIKLLEGKDEKKK